MNRLPTHNCSTKRENHKNIFKITPSQHPQHPKHILEIPNRRLNRKPHKEYGHVQNSATSVAKVKSLDKKNLMKNLMFAVFVMGISISVLALLRITHHENSLKLNEHHKYVEYNKTNTTINNDTLRYFHAKDVRMDQNVQNNRPISIISSNVLENTLKKLKPQIFQEFVLNISSFEEELKTLDSGSFVTAETAALDGTRGEATEVAAAAEVSNIFYYLLYFLNLEKNLLMSNFGSFFLSFFFLSIKY